LKKRIAISILVLFLVLFTGISASADEHDHGDVGVLYDGCPEGGKHYMVARGKGNVYVDGELVLENGITSQCNKCHTVIISENNPFHYYTTHLGDYGNESYNGPVGSFTVMSTNTLYYNSDLRDMDSYEWHNTTS
jgi:hypothetical protein